MEYGFVKVAAAVPHVLVADCFYNIGQIEQLMRKASGQDVQFIAFPELCITAYTCMDLFEQQTLLDCAEEALMQLVERTADLDIFTIVGVPLRTGNRLINAAVAFQHGTILGIVPKTYLPNYKEFQELRWFTPATSLTKENITIGQGVYPMGNLRFVSGEVAVGIEICEDLWVPVPPSCLLAMEGANLLFNISASNEIIGKNSYLRSLVTQQSARCMAGYVYASAGFGESSTDLVFAGNGMIAENGTLLQDSPRFTMQEQLIVSEIDIATLQNDRRVNVSFMQYVSSFPSPVSRVIEFDLPALRKPFILSRPVDPHPFVPSGHALNERCEEIVNIQVADLAKRLVHTHSETAVVGISGGLDSTLALLVTVMTFDALKMPRKQIIGITMPGFGTTGRTYNNAINLMESLEVTIREISIKAACLQHFEDIGHDPSVHDITYENSQARERTQILMDVANQMNGMVIGTGDLSELALGWATYNGDHMSMYGVNGSIPKTLVRSLVQWIANYKVDEQSRITLLDIADTPISPELIPADENDNITQVTEDLVGPYELHDFFLYHFIRFGSHPAKIYFLAQTAFGDKYDNETIKKWLYTFFRRFFSQQFKRSCLPDGPKVGSVSLSPRGDWRMPSDAIATLWLKEIETLK